MYLDNGPTYTVRASDICVKRVTDMPWSAWGRRVHKKMKGSEGRIGRVGIVRCVSEPQSRGAARYA